MKTWVLTLFILSFTAFLRPVKSQSISNEGKEFWAVFPSHDPSLDNVTNLPSLANIVIYVTSKSNSNVTITCGTYTETKDIKPNEVTSFTVDRAQAYIPPSEANKPGPYKNRGIHIKVNDGFADVAVYAHIYAGFRSAASLILPVESLGQKYMSMNYEQDEGGNNLLTLVAVEDNTRLLINDRGNIQVIEFDKAGEVFEFMAPNLRDLTGVSVEVDASSPDNCNKRFAAFSGSTSVSIGCKNMRDLSRDPLFQQLYPISSWGKEYGVAPFIERRYIARIMASEDNTTIRIDGGNPEVKNRGEIITTGELTGPIFISANKKISVAQYSLTQKCSGVTGFLMAGDPEMVLLNPIEFNTKAVTMFSSDKEAIEERYINVIISTKARNTFKINGAAIADGWQTFPANPQYSYRQIPITATSSNLTATEGFNAIAYGFGNAESYAYSAGTNLAANNYLLVNNTETNIDAPNACIGQKSNFKIILPFIAKSINWQLNEEDIIIGSLTHQEVTTTAGETAYQYSLELRRQFNDLATQKMQVVAEASNTGNCLTGKIEYNFEFEVFPLPTVDFRMDALNCPDSELPFTDLSISNIPNLPVNKWIWNFGDGETSTEQNPRHTYKQGGEYVVTLFAGRDDGCMMEISKTISIAPKVTAEFKVASTGCVNTDLLITDQSAVENGNIVKWTWNFGDGSAVVIKTNKDPFNHQYSKSGTYKISLVAESANGCISLVSKRDVTIYDLSESDFTLPEVCTEDDIATFQSQTGNGNVSGLTFKWDFGDPASGAANISNEVNGTHKYSIAGNYSVTLVVTNASGCSTVLVKTLTVNGSEIVADFSIIGPTTTCGNKVLLLKNNSTVNSGTITRIAWYMDAVNRPDDVIVDEQPEVGKEYEYLYPNFTTPFAKVVTIRLVAYSGTTCSGIIEKQITLQPSPILAFDMIPDVCSNTGKFAISQARETLGIAGSISLSGMGIGSDGQFDPSVAGVGTHTITFFFTTVDGCTDTLTQSITVNPLPRLTIDSNVYVLGGGKRKIVASAAGEGLSFKWSPSTGLDRDDIVDPTVTGSTDREYTLTVSNSQGCSIVQRIQLHTLPGIKPPNAFSPNGDGANDTWVLEYLDTYPDVTVEIFNRTGQRVFYSKGYSVPFDGNFKNEALPVGTYYYIINPNNKKKSITGPLTILR